jgi:DNA (cytosine-5)-methyltransferase 1
MNELALFAGAGGGILGGKLLGWSTVCAVEYDPYAASVLVARQNDGCLEPFPVWSDVQTFDGRPWRGVVDVVSGGFPCTDISAAGKGAGIEGKQSGLWSEMARIVGEVRPRFVFVENSPLLVKRGLAVVLGDPAEMGYDARWGIVGAHHVGAPHKRDRIWIVASNSNFGGQISSCQSGAAKPKQFEAFGNGCSWSLAGQRNLSDSDEDMGNWWSRRQWGCQENEGVKHQCQETESCVCGVADGMAARMDRLKAIGNGQVPAVAALAWRLLGGPTT